MSESIVSKCPHCNAKIEYDGKSDKMVCEYCGCEIGIEEFVESSEVGDIGDTADTADEFEAPGEDRKFTSEEDDKFKVFTCPSCAGQLITDANTSSTTCVYCGNPAMIPERLSGIYRPDIVIPFRMNKSDAKQALKNLYKGKPLLPKAFKSENRIENVTGVYVPFWLFDCDSDAKVVYRAKKVFTWSDSRYIYTKTDYFRLYRKGNFIFRNIPADGSKKTDDALMESIEPFNADRSEPFNASYLAGYNADKYDVEPSELQSRINARMLESIDGEFRKTTLGYTGVIKESSNIKHTNSGVIYALFPVWMLNTKYRGKNYQFAMNGETGKASGELPVDYGRFFAWLASMTLGIGALLSLLLIFIL